MQVPSFGRLWAVVSARIGILLSWFGEIYNFLHIHATKCIYRREFANWLNHIKRETKGSLRGDIAKLATTAPELREVWRERRSHDGPFAAPRDVCGSGCSGSGCGV